MLTLVDEMVEIYARAHSTPVPELLIELRKYTYDHIDLPQMQVGPLEGMFLKLLARVSRATRILEIGTFTGYSALMMAAALPEDGELVTCEIDPKIASVAQRFFNRSPDAAKIKLKVAPASKTLHSLEPQSFDMAFIDADKENYINYFKQTLPLMRKNGLIVVDNVLWSGKVLQPTEEQEASTKAISAFNDFLSKEAKLEKIMVTIRDGMTLIVT